MRKLSVLLGCGLIGAAVGCTRGPAADPQVLPTFNRVATLLDDLSRAAASVVPDAVLNRARCVAIVPMAEARPRTGTATCRDESGRWQHPALVNYISQDVPSGDILVLVLGARKAQHLTLGIMELKPAARAGPMVEKVITVTDADVAADTLSYVRGPKGLAGKAVGGTISIRQSASEIADAEPASARMVVESVTSFFNTITPIGIILHHSAVIPGDERVPTNEGEIDEFHRARGFAIRCQGHEYHVAYHYLILPDGTVKSGRPERCQGAHAKGYNAYLGIALVGDFSSTDNPTGEKGPPIPTPRQMAALTELCRGIMQRYNVPLQRVMRHSDVASTRCPGDRFPFSAVLRGLQEHP